MKSKEQFETYDAELHKDDFFYQRAGGRGRGTSVGAFSAETTAFDEAL